MSQERGAEPRNFRQALSYRYQRTHSRRHHPLAHLSQIFPKYFRCIHRVCSTAIVAVRCRLLRDANGMWCYPTHHRHSVKLRVPRDPILHQVFQGLFQMSPALKSVQCHRYLTARCGLPPIRVPCRLHPTVTLPRSNAHLVPIHCRSHRHNRVVRRNFGNSVRVPTHHSRIFQKRSKQYNRSAARRVHQ